MYRYHGISGRTIDEKISQSMGKKQKMHQSVVHIVVTLNRIASICKTKMSVGRFYCE